MMKQRYAVLNSVHPPLQPVHFLSVIIKTTEHVWSSAGYYNTSFLAKKFPRIHLVLYSALSLVRGEDGRLGGRDQRVFLDFLLVPNQLPVPTQRSTYGAD